MNVYTISGLGADESVFEGLTLTAKTIHLPWIEFLEGESISSYAIRLAEGIDQSKPFIIIGLSFGGLIAIEIAKKYNTQCNILISSAQTKDGIFPLFRIVGKSHLLEYLPKQLFDIPKPLAHFLFGTKNKELLDKILDNTDKGFIKWAINELIQWDNKLILPNTYQIHGSNDKIIPPPNGESVLLVEGGEHLMIIDRSVEVSKLINSILKEYM